MTGLRQRSTGLLHAKTHVVAENGSTVGDARGVLVRSLGQRCSIGIKRNLLSGNTESSSKSIWRIGL